MDKIQLKIRLDFFTKQNKFYHFTTLSVLSLYKVGRKFVFVINCIRVGT
jgi:hypothetical protein